MPKYHPQKLWDYTVETEPIGLFRVFMYLLGINFPYFVGDKIKLRIKLKKDKYTEDILGSSICIGGIYPHGGKGTEKFREREIPFWKNELVNEFIFESDNDEISSKDGHLYIYARKTFGEGSDKEFIIFSTDVKHDENFMWFVVIPSILTIVGIIIGILIAR